MKAGEWGKWCSVLEGVHSLCLWTTATGAQGRAADAITCPSRQRVLPGVARYERWSTDRVHLGHMLPCQYPAAAALRAALLAATLPGAAQPRSSCRPCLGAGAAACPCTTPTQRPAHAVRPHGRSSAGATRHQRESLLSYPCPARTQGRHSESALSLKAPTGSCPAAGSHRRHISTHCALLELWRSSHTAAPLLRLGLGSLRRPACHTPRCAPIQPPPARHHQLPHPPHTFSFPPHALRMPPGTRVAPKLSRPLPAMAARAPASRLPAPPSPAPFATLPLHG